jgi:hypothetical protein
VGNLAATDRTILDALLQDVRSSESAVQALLAETAARAGLYRDMPNPPPALTYTAPPAYAPPPGAPAYQPNTTPGIAQPVVTEATLDHAQTHLAQQFTRPQELTPVTCPHCGGGFFIDKQNAA